jgi:hypothetical protein
VNEVKENPEDGGAAMSFYQTENILIAKERR